jgi:hypothetical protein
MFSFKYFFFFVESWKLLLLKWPLLIIFVPRRTSNWRKVRFGEVAVLKQIYVLYRKNSWKFTERLFHLRFSCSHAPGCCQTFIIFALFDLSDRRSSEKSIFTSCSVLTDFCHYLCLPLDRFLFEFFWSRNFWGSYYSILCFNGCYSWVETEPKRVDLLSCLH